MISQSDSFVMDYRASTSEDEVERTKLQVTTLALAVGLYVLAALLIF
jgi:hypothetical protein